MPEFIRLRNDATGAEFTVPADIELGDDVTVIDKDATNREGVPLPPKYKTSLRSPGGRSPARQVATFEPPTNPAPKATTPKKE